MIHGSNNKIYSIYNMNENNITPLNYISDIQLGQL